MPIPTWDLIRIWVAVALTFGLYSFLYRDNPVFKLCEHIFVGVGMGYLLVYTAAEVVYPDLLKPLWRVGLSLAGRTIEPALQPYESLWLLVPAVLSLFMLMRFFPKTAWLSRWSFAFFVGTGAGLLIPAGISAQLFKQLEPTLMPLWSKDGDWAQSVNTVLILVGVISVLVYFFFSVEHKGTVRVISKIGIWYLMVAFGAAFGYTVMARESLLIRRILELRDSTGREHFYATWILFGLVAASIATIEVMRRSRTGASPPQA